ncbi:hypothetical protein MRX96_028802 [Rhipicephalus microplus]
MPENKAFIEIVVGLYLCLTFALLVVEGMVSFIDATNVDRNRRPYIWMTGAFDCFFHVIHLILILAWAACMYTDNYNGMANVLVGISAHVMGIGLCTTIDVVRMFFAKVRRKEKPSTCTLFSAHRSYTIVTRLSREWCMEKKNQKMQHFRPPYLGSYWQRQIMHREKVVSAKPFLYKAILLFHRGEFKGPSFYGSFDDRIFACEVPQSYHPGFPYGRFRMPSIFIVSVVYDMPSIETRQQPLAQCPD